MTKNVATVALQRALAIGDEIAGSGAHLRANVPAEECGPYRLALAKMAGEMLLSVINPIVAQHPDLRPPGLKAR